MNIKQRKAFERIFKGVSNHWRIEILFQIKNNPRINIEEVVKNIKANYATTAEHINRLKNAGLINKKYKGSSIELSLSPYGNVIIDFIDHFK
jgi:predicted transcriptional regulator